MSPLVSMLFRTFLNPFKFLMKIFAILVRTHLPPPTYQVPPERQGQWQPRLSRVSRRSTQPSTNAISSHRWPSRRQALLGRRPSCSWEIWVAASNRSPGKPSLSPTCGNACPSLSNGEMPLQWWEQWGAPPPALISFLDYLSFFGGHWVLPL